jgi:hypothetical protein
MKQIAPQDAGKYADTHRIFFEANITAQTDKAFRVSMRNNQGANDSFWLPKSKLLFCDIAVTQMYIPMGSGYVQNPEYQTTRRKYLIPKFFTK